MDIEMQGYAPIPSGTTLKDSLALLQANDDAAISNNAGTAFPTTNLVVGMTCFRTDLGVLHTLVSTSPVTWVAGISASGVFQNGAFYLGGTTDDGSSARLRVFGTISNLNTANGNAGLLLTGTSGFSAGLHLNNNTATTGRKYSLYSNNSGNLVVGDETGASVLMSVVGSAGRFLFGAADDGTNKFQVGGTVKGYNLMAANSGTSQATLSLVRDGAAADEKRFEVMQASSGTFAIRTVNDAYTASSNALTITRATGYHMAAMRLMEGEGVVLVGTTTDDGSGAKLQVSGPASLSGALYARSSVNLEGAAAGTSVPLIFRQNNLSRFSLAADSSSNLSLSRYDDTGVFQDTPLVVSRSTGQVSLNGSTVIDGTAMKTPGASTLILNAKVGSQSAIIGQQGGSPRWNLVLTDGDGHLRLYRNPTGSSYVAALTCNLATGATGVVSLAADSLIATNGYMTSQNGFVSYSVAGSGRAAFTSSGNNGQGWDDWSGVGQPAIQVDMPNAGSAFPIIRGTRWGGKHVFAIHGYEGVNNNDQRISFAITSANQFVFNANGQGWANGGWQGTSDARVKTGREVIQNAGAKLDTLTGETYYRIDLDDNNRRYAGVIAQAVQAVVPEAISELDGILGVDIAGVVGLVVEALKETRQQVRDLMERVYQLEKGNA